MVRVERTQWFDVDMRPVSADSGRAVYCVLAGTLLPEYLARRLGVIGEVKHVTGPPEDKAARIHGGRGRARGH